MHLQDLCSRFDDRLSQESFDDIDPSANGLQVGPDTQSVDKVGFAVDAAMETINQAIEAGADVLVTHHGIIWNDIERVTGQTYTRLNTLMTANMSLYVSHLPLDGHQEIGNAASIASLLDLTDRRPFGQVGDEYIGQQGSFDTPTSLSRLVEIISSDVAREFEPKVFEFGPDTVTSVGIVTGSGADHIHAAAEHDIDCFITGEGKQHLYHDAKEHEINVILGGHYGTEVFGVKHLQTLAEEWGLETVFIDHPTRL
ncbi:MAG: Nif3-like dinuclear metal center hexameric protein [Halobacteriaceae archaeon]